MIVNILQGGQVVTREHTQETTEGEGVVGNNEDRGRYGVEKWEKEEVKGRRGCRGSRENHIQNA